jgi:hypothetical protein
VTFTGELDIWLFFCFIGLVTSVLSLRLAHLVLNAVVTRSASPEVIDGSKHLWRTELERVIGWFMFFSAGAVASFDDREIPFGMTMVSMIVKWILIGTIILWSYKTSSDFFYSRKMWLRTKEKMQLEFSGK